MSTYGDWQTLCPEQTFTQAGLEKNFPDSPYDPWTVLDVSSSLVTASFRTATGTNSAFRHRRGDLPNMDPKGELHIPGSSKLLTK